MFVVPSLILKICWLILFARAGYMVYLLINQRRHKDWFKIIFYLALAIIALSFI